MMLTRVNRVFYISAEALEVYLRHGTEFQPVERFLLADNGQQKFADYVAFNPGVYSVVVVDVIEEEYKLEQIPKISAAERRSFLQRRMSQHFRNAGYRLATVTGRVRAARMEESVVMSALTNGQLLDTWLYQLYQYRVPVAGIYSAPYLEAKIARGNAPRHDYTVLVSYHENIGLRQTLVHAGHVLLSRLCPLELVDADNYRQALARELEKTERYINNLRLVPPDQEIHVQVLASDSLPLAGDAPPALGSRPVHYITPASWQKRQGESAAVEAPMKSRLCAIAAAGLPAGNYATGRQLYFFRQYRLQSALRTAALLATLLFAGVLGHGLRQIYVSDQSVTALESQGRQYEQEYFAIVDNTVSTDVSPQFIKDSVEVATQLGQRRLRLDLLLGGISVELRQYQNIEVMSMEWVKGSRVLQAQTAATGNEFYTEVYPMPGLGQDDEVVLLHGRVVTASKGYIDIFHMLSRLTARLEKVPELKNVQLVRLPIDKESSGQIDGRYNAWRPELQAEFVLRAVYHEH